jgi:hypothetical protein
MRPTVKRLVLEQKIKVTNPYDDEAPGKKRRSRYFLLLECWSTHRSLAEGQGSSSQRFGSPLDWVLLASSLVDLTGWIAQAHDTPSDTTAFCRGMINEILISGRLP